MSEKGKRIIIPKELTNRRSGSVDVTRVPHIDAVLESALAVISNEITKYSKKSFEKSIVLDPKEARIVQGYVESLAKARREQREMEKEDSQDLSKLSDEEIVALLESKKSEDTNE